MVGRLGFEPRQRDSKSLDLPLVDRPVHRRLQLDLTIDLTSIELRSIELRYRPARSLCEQPSPVLGSVQGLRQECLHARGLDALLSRLRICFRPVKSK